MERRVLRAVFEHPGGGGEAGGARGTQAEPRRARRTSGLKS